jgi:chemotaxis protein methyltransferase CheR
VAELELSPQIFNLFAGLIEERLGLHYGAGERELLAYKLASRATEAGFYSLLDYYYHLRYDDPSGTELSALTDALVVNETFFFRERAPLERVIEAHVAPLCARKVRPRIWCAASSTGEEPFTLAILLAERGLLPKVEILATDISQRALARAQSGVLSHRALREGHPGDLAAKYLHISDEGVRVSPVIRAAVRFQGMNLLDRAAMAELGHFDVILCRNVLIYFRDERTKEVINNLTAALKPGGVLLVGVSESLLRFGTALLCEERAGSFFYRKENG